MLTFKFEDEELMLVRESYLWDGRLAIMLHSSRGPFAKLTVNVPEARLGPGEFLVKGWSENEALIESARASGLFQDTGKRVQAGYCQAEVWRLAEGVQL